MDDSFKSLSLDLQSKLVGKIHICCRFHCVGYIWKELETLEESVRLHHLINTL